MKILHFILMVLIPVLSLKAQLNGIILNKETLEPVPYVNIQVEGSRIGYSSDINGNYIVEQEAASLTFSAIGYKLRKVNSIKEVDTILLDPLSYRLKEVEVLSEDKSVAIGKLKRNLFNNKFGNCFGAFMLAMKFPYQKDYDETSYLNTISFLTHSYGGSNQKFNIRLLRVDSIGGPGMPIHNKPITVELESRKERVIVELKELYLKFPEEGLFVVIEWLAIEENYYIREGSNVESKERITDHCYGPEFLCSYKEMESDTWIFTGVDWYKFEMLHPIQVKIELTN